MVELKRERPPNFSKIADVFPGAYEPGVVFAYAPYIYAPSFKSIEDLPLEIVEHEKAHIARQEKVGVEVWWFRYLREPIFRYYEELLGHRAEYKSICEQAGNTRQVRRSALKSTASKMAAPLYGNMAKTAVIMEALKAPEVYLCQTCNLTGLTRGEYKGSQMIVEGPCFNCSGKGFFYEAA